MFKLKQIKTEQFYPTLCEWWDGHNFQKVSPSMLPEFTFVVQNEEGLDIYSICFYNTDSNLCWLGWPTSNPKANKEQKKGGFKHLMRCMELTAMARDYQIMFTTSNTPAVERMLLECEYVVGDKNVNHYIKII